MQAKNSNSNTRSSGKDKPKLKFTLEIQSRDEIIEQGRQASELLASPVFNVAWQSTVQTLQDEIITTQPHEVQKREYLNLKIQALGEVAGDLKMMYSEALRVSTDSLSREAGRQDAMRQHNFDIANRGSGLPDSYDSAYTGGEGQR